MARPEGQVAGIHKDRTAEELSSAGCPTAGSCLDVGSLLYTGKAALLLNHTASDHIWYSRLRIVTGIYRAIPVREIEKEAFVPQIELYCKDLYAKYIRRTYTLPDQLGEPKGARARRLEQKSSTSGMERPLDTGADKYFKLARNRPDSKNLKLYSWLQKAESSILFQYFLASARVPGIESGEPTSAVLGAGYTVRGARIGGGDSSSSCEAADP
ncbi:hypothetical protein CJF30_00008720 [Rutstroemia sp. NJR-2017a BBW]|nr:hypothetical protein CJF30_00008720 [Rutstroemia sp. NJR-2017a BBW]